MKKRLIIQFSKKVITIALIFSLLMTSNAPSFAQLLLPEDETSGLPTYDISTYTHYRDEVSETIKPKAEGSTKAYMEAIIREKYQEMVNNLQGEILDLSSTINSLENRAMTNDMHVNSTIVEPASVRETTYRDQARLGQEERSKKDSLKKLKKDQNGYGRMRAIEALLYGDEEDEHNQALMDMQDNNGADTLRNADIGSPEEMDAFEEEYVYYLVNELLKITKNEFLFHIYKLIPYIKGKSDPRWNKIKNKIKSDANAYLKYVATVKDPDAWVKTSDMLVKMLPDIKGEVPENIYTSMLNTAQVNLEGAMRQCIDGNDCENYANLLAKEIFLYMLGEEKKYSSEIRDGYDHGVRAAILNLGKRTSGYEYYNTVMLTALTTYLELKQYYVIEDIIATQEWAEEELKMQPISGTDTLSFTTYVQAGLTLNLCRDVVTYYPDIPALPSRKGQYVGENGSKENIWWDLGEMLKEDGSKEAQAILEKEINKITKRFDATRGSRGEEVLNLGHLGILKISALVNINKDIPGAEEKAKEIMNTSYGDLTFDEEKAIDTALSTRYPSLQGETSLGSLITPEGEAHKQDSQNLINRWNYFGQGVDIAMIVVSVASLVVSIGKLLIKGCRLGVGLYRAMKAARMAQKSAKQIAYIRKNIRSIQYYKAWRASRATRLGTGSRAVASSSKTTPVRPPRSAKTTQARTNTPMRQNTTLEPATSARPRGNNTRPTQIRTGEVRPNMNPAAKTGRTPSAATEVPTAKSTSLSQPTTQPASMPSQAPKQPTTALSPEQLGQKLTGEFDATLAQAGNTEPARGIGFRPQPESVPTFDPNRGIGYRPQPASVGTVDPNRGIGFHPQPRSVGTPTETPTRAGFKFYDDAPTTLPGSQTPNAGGQGFQDLTKGTKGPKGKGPKGPEGLRPETPGSSRNPYEVTNKLDNPTGGPVQGPDLADLNKQITNRPMKKETDIADIASGKLTKDFDGTRIGDKQKAAAREWIKQNNTTFRDATKVELAPNGQSVIITDSRGKTKTAKLKDFEAWVGNDNEFGIGLSPERRQSIEGLDNVLNGGNAKPIGFNSPSAAAAQEAGNVARETANAPQTASRILKDQDNFRLLEETKKGLGTVTDDVTSLSTCGTAARCKQILENLSKNRQTFVEYLSKLQQQFAKATGNSSPEAFYEALRQSADTPQALKNFLGNPELRGFVLNNGSIPGLNNISNTMLSSMDWQDIGRLLKSDTPESLKLLQQLSTSDDWNGVLGQARKILSNKKDFHLEHYTDLLDHIEATYPRSKSLVGSLRKGGTPKKAELLGIGVKEDAVDDLLYYFDNLKGIEAALK